MGWIESVELQCNNKQYIWKTILGQVELNGETNNNTTYALFITENQPPIKTTKHKYRPELCQTEKQNLPLGIVKIFGEKTREEIIPRKYLKQS